jgi:hypothetical protein
MDTFQKSDDLTYNGPATVVFFLDNGQKMSFWTMDNLTYNGPATVVMSIVQKKWTC